MKLYEVKPNSMIRVIDNTATPPASISISPNDVLKFYHIDGMYSLCKNSKGEWVHLVAWSDVEVLNNQKDFTIN